MDIKSKNALFVLPLTQIFTSFQVQKLSSGHLTAQVDSVSIIILISHDNIPFVIIHTPYRNNVQQNKQYIIIYFFLFCLVWFCFVFILTASWCFSLEKRKTKNKQTKKTKTSAPILGVLASRLSDASDWFSKGGVPHARHVAESYLQVW